MSEKIEGPTLLGFGDFFVGAGKPPPGRGGAGKPPPGRGGATGGRGASVKFAKLSGKSSPHGLALFGKDGKGGAQGAAQRALATAKRVRGVVARYKKDAAAGKHAPLVRLAPTKVRGDGAVVLGAAPSGSEARKGFSKLTDKQRAAVEKHAKAVMKNAALNKRLNVAASKAQRAGAKASGFIKVAIPVMRRLAGGRPGKTGVKGLDDETLLGALAGLDDEDVAALRGLVGLDEVGQDDFEEPLPNEPGVGGYDPSTGMVFDPDGNVLYDPNNDLEIVPLPERAGGSPPAEELRQAVRKLPPDAIVYDGFPHGIPGSTQKMSVAIHDAFGSAEGFLSGVDNETDPGGHNMYRWSRSPERWVYYKEGPDGVAADASEKSNSGVQAISLQRGWGPLIGQPGHLYANGLQYAQDDDKWFWQAKYAPRWATAEADAKIAEANRVIVKTKTADAVARAAEIAKTRADEVEKQRKIEAERVLAEQEQTRAEEKAAGELSIAEAKAESERAVEEGKQAAEQARLELEARKVELEAMKAEAQASAAQQAAMLQQAGVWNQWAQANPAAAVQQMQQVAPGFTPATASYFADAPGEGGFDVEDGSSMMVDEDGGQVVDFSRGESPDESEDPFSDDGQSMDEGFEE